MEKKRILLVGARKKILRQLEETLAGEGFAVKQTHKYKKVVDEFWDEKFDLVAFGRGVPDVEKDKIKGVFSTKNHEAVFVEGMAPIIPLLVYQVKSALAPKDGSKKLKEFKLEQKSEVKLLLEVDKKSHIKVMLYYLDFWYRTHQHCFLNSDLNQGQYSITIEKKRDKAFLVVDVNGEEIYIHTF